MSSMSPLERRLRLLRAEVELDFPGLIEELDSGMQVVLVTDSELGKDLSPDVLRRIGGMVMMCNHHGAAVIFVNERKFTELNSKVPSKI